MGIKHHTQTAKPDDPNYDVSADAWNEDHDIDDGSITEAKIAFNTASGHDHDGSDSKALPDSSYPNALLRDGSRTITDDLTFETDTKHIQWSDVGLYRDQAGRIRVSTAGGTGLRDFYARTLYSSLAAFINLQTFSSETRYWRLGTSNAKIQLQKADATVLFEINSGGQVLMPNLPTSDPGVAGQLYNENGTLKISSG